MDVRTARRPTSTSSWLPRLLALACIVAGGQAQAITVINTSDSGVGSLRAAITEANASPDTSTITFDIPGACPRRITLLSPLPQITQPTIIDGYSQPGSAVNTVNLSLRSNATLCIELVNGGGNNVPRGLWLNPAVDTLTSRISGMAIGGFTNGIRIENGDFTLAGNFVGMAANGSSAIPNHVGISASGTNVFETYQRRIGDGTAASVNLVSGNTSTGIVASAAKMQIRRNLVGANRNGNVAIGNNVGVSIFQPDIDVRGNLISGNTGSGVNVSSGSQVTGLLIESNRIGLNACLLGDNCALGNGGHGINVGNSNVAIAGNSIAFNGGDGVFVTDNANQVSITANAIHSNNGLGIDLAPDGPNPINNDAIEPGSAANSGLNAPELTSARGGPRNGQVLGRLRSTNGVYRIEFYASDEADPSLRGEGQRHLGDGNFVIANAPPGGNGEVQFNLPINTSIDLSGQVISALVFRHPDVFENTSEFSNVVVYETIDLIFAHGFD